MPYPPPPYADAACGEAVAGEAICGAWWAYPLQPGLALGGTLPQLVELYPNVAPSAGLGLGANLPVVRVIPHVPPAGLGLGAYLPTIPTIVNPAAAGLGLGAAPPGFRISQIAHIPDTGLGLGSYLPEAEIHWLHPLTCVEIPLAAASPVALVLAPAPCADLPLEPAEAR